MYKVYNVLQAICLPEAEGEREIGSFNAITFKHMGTRLCLFVQGMFSHPYLSSKKNLNVLKMIALKTGEVLHVGNLSWRLGTADI